MLDIGGDSMSDAIQIEVRNLDVIEKNIAKVADDLPQYVGSANLEASREVLDTQGLRKYPPATSANQPPVPYYIRGRGTQTAGGNLGNSERLGTRWQTVPYGRLGMKISNPVSYARYVHGEEQASFMAPKGWRKLIDVAREKIGTISAVYNKWMDRLVKDKGL